MIALFKSGDSNLYLSTMKMATVVEKILVCTSHLRRGNTENCTPELTNTRTSSLSHSTTVIVPRFLEDHRVQSSWRKCHGTN